MVRIILGKGFCYIALPVIALWWFFEEIWDAVSLRLRRRNKELR